MNHHSNECLGSNHYFALFGLPVAFDIDKDLLKQNLLKLQKQHHPDKQALTDNTPTSHSNADLTNVKPTNTSSELINQAYQTLFCDELRAIYLLELAGLAVNLDNSIDDVRFLSLMMDSRIVLAESDCADEIAHIYAQLETLNGQLVQDFANAYAQKNWQNAQRLALKLKFLAKLKHDTQQNKHKTSLDQSDDDLYV